MIERGGVPWQGAARCCHPGGKVRNRSAPSWARSAVNGSRRLAPQGWPEWHFFFRSSRRDSAVFVSSGLRGQSAPWTSLPFPPLAAPCAEKQQRHRAGLFNVQKLGGEGVAGVAQPGARGIALGHLLQKQARQAGQARTGWAKAKGPGAVAERASAPTIRSHEVSRRRRRVLPYSEPPSPEPRRAKFECRGLLPCCATAQ